MSRRSYRFSVRDLMILIAAVAGLLGIVVASRNASERAQQAAWRKKCLNNLKQIGLSIHGYAYLDDDTFPCGTVPNPGLPPEKRLNWHLSMGSYMDYGQIYPDIAKAEPWDSPTNAPFAYTEIREQRCPDEPAPRSGRPVPTPYVGIAGPGLDAPTSPKSDRRAGVFGYDRATRQADIKDGLGSTMMVVETWDERGSWLAGGPATVRGLDPAHPPYIGPRRQFGGLHRDGVCVLFADGHARFVSASTDPRIFEALSTIAGGETIPEDW